eukprot:Gb_13137 [translate_table: standard]
MYCSGQSWVRDCPPFNNRIIGNGTQYILMADGSSGALVDYRYAIDEDDIVDGVNPVGRRPLVKIMLPNIMNVTQISDSQHIHLMLLVAQSRRWAVKNGIRGELLVHILLSVAVGELIRLEELPPAVALSVGGGSRIRQNTPVGCRMMVGARGDDGTSVDESALVEYQRYRHLSKSSHVGSYYKTHVDNVTGGVGNYVYQQRCQSM